MNKVIPTDERVFMSLVGPSGSGKSQLVADMLSNGTFQPSYDKIIYFYQHFQPLYSDMLSNIQNIEFIQCVNFELVENLPSDGTNYLLIFDDSCAEISRSKEFEKIATSGRHKKLNAIYIKHNLFHKSAIGRDVELQNTHIVLFKSPRDVNQITRLGQQLGLGKKLTEWYKSATSKPFGHLLIDLSPRVSDKLRYCTDCGTFPTKFFLPPAEARITQLNDLHTKRVYTQALPEFYAQLPTSFLTAVPKGLHSVPVRVRAEHSSRKFESTKKSAGKIQKTNQKIGTNTPNTKRKKTNHFLK